jgi:hypothetical protein
VNWYLLTSIDSEFLDQALSIYGEKNWKGERARVYWWKSRLVSDSSESKECRDQAVELMRDIAPERPTESLTDNDFDEMVVYWSR